MSQGQSSVSGRTRGEYYRPLNLDSLSDRQDGFTFVCPKHQNFAIMLKPARKYVVDGEVIKERGVAARFTEYRFFTSKRESAKLLRASRAFKMGVIKERRVAKADRAATKAEKLKQLLEEDPELMEAARQMLPKAKGKTPTSEKPKDAAPAS